MHLILSPERRDDRLTVSVTGDVITINGEAYDLSVIPEGATLPRGATDCAWLAGDIERVGGQLIVPLILPHGAKAGPATLFPAPITVTADGPVDLPAYEEAEA